MGKLYIALLLLHFTAPALGLYKRWLRSTNFGDPKNWNGGRAPCGNDVVIIPDESPVVYIQTNTTLQELALPNNGEIIFGQMLLAFTDTPSSDCASTGGDLEFSVAVPRPWVNPDNWCSSATETGQCTNYPLLTSEKIPCATDNAVFPRNEAFYVGLGSGLSISVLTLHFSGKSYTTNTFNNYRSTPDGQRIFPPPKGQGATNSNITVIKQACTDPTGCKCGNDQGKIFQSICAVYSSKCDRAKCKVPFRPMGSCCDMCGAVFNGTVGSGFRIADFRTIMQKFITDRNDNGTVELIISKTGLGTIQAVLTGDNGDTSVPIANAIKADMDADARTGGHKYRLDGIQLMESSGAIEPTPPSRHTGGNIGGGGIAGIVIALIVVVVLVLFGLLMYRKRTGRSSNMIDDLMETPNRIRRTMPRGRRVPSDVASRPAYPEIEMDSGFGNPLYGDIGGIAGGDVKPMTLMPAEIQPTFDATDTDGGFNNPLYDTVKKDGTFVDPGAISASMELGTGDSRNTDSNI